MTPDKLTVSPTKLKITSWFPPQKATFRTARFYPERPVVLPPGKAMMGTETMGVSMAYLELEQAQWLATQGAESLETYRQTGRGEALDVAVTAFRRLVNGLRPDDQNLGVCLSNLGAALNMRFGKTGDRADLDAAIDAFVRGARLFPPGHPYRPACLSNLGSALRVRFEEAGDESDLAAAIEVGQQAVELTSDDDPDLAHRLSGLSGSLERRFEHAGDDADLDAAIRAGQQAVELTPPGHPSRAIYQGNLAVELRARYGRAGDATDLDAAIDACSEAARLLPPGHPNYAACLSILGSALRDRSERTGDGADLDAAIDVTRRAVELSLDRHPSSAMYLANLGSALLARYGRDGDAADLDAAVDVGRQAARLTPDGHPSLARRLSDLAGILKARFDRTGDDADLDALIGTAQRAAELTPDGDSDLASRLSNLAGFLVLRSERTGDDADLDDAIRAARRSVQLTPGGDPRRAGCLSNLASTLAARFARSGDRADLEAVVGADQQAVELTPDGHPELVTELLNLGVAFRDRYLLAGDNADLTAALGCWDRASLVPTGIPSMRVRAGQLRGFTAVEAARTHEAAEGYAVAVGLLAKAAWHGLNRATREEQLTQWAGLAADAAACAVLDDRPARAVELLEQGRSVMWTQALNLRSDLSRLAEAAPELAERLDGLRRLLDAPPSGLPNGGLADPRQEAELRRRKAREWDEVLDQVQAMDGFEDFLTIRRYAQLTAAAQGGPVVILNVSAHGCHALIVDHGGDRPRVVGLPALSLEAAVEQADALMTVVADADDAGKSIADKAKEHGAVTDILDWLWRAVAEPVLAALGDTDTPGPDDTWPRVWWCPTGPLCLLPVHAAGQRGVGQGRCVLDRVISSYTPTLTALSRSREPLVPVPVRHLGVGLAGTPGQAPLPSVPAEMAVLARYFPPGEAHRQITGSEAIRATVLDGLAKCSWAHLACHARQEYADPDVSGFALWDGPLTLGDLAAQPGERRELAFLSACETAAGSVRHPDEAIHLAAAMQFLGYRHVVATMWTIADTAAPRVAGLFYGGITHSGPDPGPSAQALHHAMRSLRQDYPRNPLLWAPYIHLGP